MSRHLRQPEFPLTRRILVCVLSVVFAALLGSASVAVVAPKECRARIQVELEPSVPNPRDPNFLSALVANPLYQASWVSGTDTTAVYDLTGPATDYRCENGIDLVRRNANVMDLKVLESGTEPDSDERDANR